MAERAEPTQWVSARRRENTGEPGGTRLIPERSVCLSSVRMHAQPGGTTHLLFKKNGGFWGDISLGHRTVLQDATLSSCPD